MYACIFFSCMCTSMCCRLEGLGTGLDKQTLVCPICSPATLITTRVLRGATVKNGSTVPQKQKYHIVKQLIGQLLVYFTALLVQICIPFCLPLLVIVRGWLGLDSFSFYFCFSVMTKMGFINSQFDSHRQTNASWVCDLHVVYFMYLVWPT